jgi:hypothetical protein
MKRFQWMVVPALLLPLCAVAQRKPVAYSAEEIQENNQVLSDGTKIHSETHTKIYRDSAGRVRKEVGDVAVIYDPVADASYALNLKDQTAQKLAFKVALHEAAAPSDGEGVTTIDVTPRTSGYSYAASITLPRAGDNHATYGTSGSIGSSGSSDASMNTIKEQVTMQMTWWLGTPRPSAGNPTTREELGVQTFDGIAARGTRHTRTIPQGEVGNDLPFQTINETWFTEELGGLPVVNKWSDPRNGEHITRLINISRSEPDISLFQVPPGYKIQ